MNPELLAQQQQLLNQAMQNAQHAQMRIWVISIAGFLLVCFVIYMFYLRLQGIEDEIRKFRIAYEFSHKPESHSVSHHD